MLLWILAATLLDGLMALVGAVILFFKEKLAQKIVSALVAFSAGSILAGAFFHLIAESLEKFTPELVFLVVLIGFSLFFIIERYFWWHHCHESKCEVHPVNNLVLLGDGIHNFIDGAVIAASFFISVEFGLITTFLIISHEIPQELGDFAILVRGGYSKGKALFFNFLSQITAVFGGILIYLLGSFPEVIELLLPLAAGGFIYISASDLIPELHREIDRRRSLFSFALFLVGLGFTIAFKHLIE